MEGGSWNIKMNGLNKSLSKAVPFFTPIGVILGILLGSYVSWMKPSVNYLFGLLTFTGALSISAGDFFNTIKKPKFIICYIVFSIIIMPLFTYALSNLFFKSSLDLCCGFIVVRAIPTAVVGSVWASIFSGNMAISLALVTLDTITAPVITPVIIRLLTQTSTPIDALGMVKSLLIMVVIPAILGMIFNELKGGVVRKTIQPTLQPFSKLILPFVIMISCSSVAERLIADASPRYIVIAVFAFVLCVSGYAIGLLSTKIFKFNKPDTVSLTYAIAMRNTTAALVIAIGYLPPDAALPAIFCIVFQQMTGAFVGGILFRGGTLSPENQNSCS